MPAVRVRVLLAHTSDARVPKVVSERTELAQTAVGIVTPSDDEAVRTVEFVFASIVEMAEVNCEFVFASMMLAKDEDAVAIVPFTEEVTPAV